MSDVAGLVALLAIAAVLLILLLTWILLRAMRRPPRRAAGYAVARGLPCDPGEVGAAYESWVLDRPGGVMLPVWEIAGAGPGGPVVVMVHGWGQSRIDMLARIEPWRAAARSVVLYDLRGHGDASEGTSPLGHDEHADLLALLDRLPDAPTVLVGHSMGAVIALHAVAGASEDAGSGRGAERAARVAGIVAVGPYVDFHRSLRGRIEMHGYPARPMTDLALAALRAVGVRPPGALPAAAAVRVPVLVLHGRDDPISPLDHGERVASAAADAELHTIDGAGHLDLHDAARDDHDRAVRTFLERVTSGFGTNASRPVTE